jgi:hypothetical protein
MVPFIREFKSDEDGKNSFFRNFLKGRSICRNGLMPHLVINFGRSAARMLDKKEKIKLPKSKKNTLALS